jgi:hypothetical protein
MPGSGCPPGFAGLAGVRVHDLGTRGQDGRGEIMEIACSVIAAMPVRSWLASCRQIPGRRDVNVLDLPRGGVPVACEVAAALWVRHWTCSSFAS